MKSLRNQRTDFKAGAQGVSASGNLIQIVLVILGLLVALIMLVPWAMRQFGKGAGGAIEGAIEGAGNIATTFVETVATTAGDSYKIVKNAASGILAEASQVSGGTAAKLAAETALAARVTSLRNMGGGTRMPQQMALNIANAGILYCQGNEAALWDALMAYVAYRANKLAKPPGLLTAKELAWTYKDAANILQAFGVQVLEIDPIFGTELETSGNLVSVPIVHPLIFADFQAAIPAMDKQDSSAVAVAKAFRTLTF